LRSFAREDRLRSYLASSHEFVVSDQGHIIWPRVRPQMLSTM
jgi:hypothetical protein